MAKKKYKKILNFIPALIWMAVIFYFSSRSTTGIGTGATQRFVILKSFHLIEYAFLAILLWFGFRKYKYTIITGYLYGISDEFHQSFIPGRTSRFRDTLFDLAGVLIGIFLISQIKKLKIFKKFLS